MKNGTKKKYKKRKFVPKEGIVPESALFCRYSSYMASRFLKDVGICPVKELSFIYLIRVMNNWFSTYKDANDNREVPKKSGIVPCNKLFATFL